MGTYFLAPAQNHLQKTLSGGISDSVTTITLNNTTSLLAPGYIVIDRENSAGTATPNSREVVYYTGISGSDLTGCVRGADGSTNRTHSDGAIVETFPSVGMWNNLATITSTAIDSNGYLKAIPSPVSIARMQITQTAVSSIASIARAEIATLIVGDIPSLSVSSIASIARLQVGSIAQPYDGWTLATDTWTYASASTFTIAGVDRTAIFTKGTRLKFTNSSLKYAVVVSSAFATDTTVTIAVNTDYVIANAAITSPYYSYQVSPQGYPAQFSYTPALTNITLGDGTLAFKYSVVGGRVSVVGKFTFGGTSSVGGSMIFALPVTGLTAQNNFYQVAGQIEDNGTTEYIASLTQESTTTVSVSAISTGSTYAQRTNTSSTVPMTWAINDAFRVMFIYDIA